MRLSDAFFLCWKSDTSSRPFPRTLSKTKTSVHVWAGGATSSSDGVKTRARCGALLLQLCQPTRTGCKTLAFLNAICHKHIYTLELRAANVINYCRISFNVFRRRTSLQFLFLLQCSNDDVGKEMLLKKRKHFWVATLRLLTYGKNKSRTSATTKFSRTDSWATWKMQVKAKSKDCFKKINK